MYFFFFAILSVIAVAIVIILITSSVTNAPYLPSDEGSVRAMVALAKPSPGEKTVDLGSGDGRIVIAMAKVGAKAEGYEINPLLVLWSRYKIRREKIEDRATIHWKSFWPADLGQFDVVTMFTLPYFMTRLEKKIGKEMRDGTRFISNGSPLPTALPEKPESKNGFYLYKIKRLQLNSNNI